MSIDLVKSWLPLASVLVFLVGLYIGISKPRKDRPIDRFVKKYGLAIGVALIAITVIWSIVIK